MSLGANNPKNVNRIGKHGENKLIVNEMMMKSALY
jgi:hypothetical protein